MRKYYWYISIFIKKHGVLVLVSIIAAIIIFSIFLPFLLRFLDFKKTSYVGVVGSYSLTTLPRNIENQISSGLTAIQADGTPVPALADRWNTENDGKTYRFLIKKKIYWQDGKEFTASDVNYNFNKVQKITTANEVLFKLPEQFSPFPSVVSQPIFRVIDEPYFFFFKKKRVIGTGNFQVTDYQEHGQRLTELVLNSADEKIVYRFYLTEEDAVAGFKRGEVDVLPDLSSTYDLKNWSTVDIKETIDNQTYLGVFFNTSSNILSSNEVRQALNYAVRKPSDATRAVGPISPTSWAFANVGKSYDYDESRAIDRLLTALPGEPIHFDLTTLPLFSYEADQIKKDWEALGQHAYTKCQSDSAIKDKAQCANVQIKVNIRLTNFPDTNNFDALLVGQESPTDPDQYSLWHSQQQTNFTQYKNVRIDSELEKGRQTEDRQKRLAIYQDFQQFFSEDAPVIFIRHLNKYEMKRKGK